MNGLYLTLPIFLPLVGGLVSYLIRFPNSRSRHLFYGVLICLTSAVTWLSILRCGSESFQRNAHHRQPARRCLRRHTPHLRQP